MGSQFGLPPFLFPEGGREEEGEKEKGGCHPFVGWCAPLLLPMWPIYFLGVPGTPFGDPIPFQYVPKHFRCPNTIVLYINLYLSTISRLLVMSVISSGTPKKLQSSNHITHNTNRHQTLSVWTLQVRELCRHDRDTSPVNNQ